MIIIHILSTRKPSTGKVSSLLRATQPGSSRLSSDPRPSPSRAWPFDNSAAMSKEESFQQYSCVCSRTFGKWREG